LLVVVSIMSVIMGGLLTAYLNGSTAVNDLNQRFTAGQEARLALGGLRQDGHRSCGVTTSAAANATFQYWDASNSVCIAINAANCTNGTLCTTWCTRAVGSQFTLYRIAAAACGANGGVAETNYLTSGNVFTYSAGVSSGTNAHDLSSLGISLSVNANPKVPHDAYSFQDYVVLRNGARS
jgi:type II secretory pathway pseudopilin PulG